jgi:hypothetical protein
MAVARLVGGRFELGPVVGSGGMGEVFRARDLERGGLVAVKVLRAGVDHERFAREARLLAQLHDDHVVGYVAHGTEPDGSHYLAMQWIEGDTVYERLSTIGFDVQESVWLAISIARGLAAAHLLGMVHRDIKPSNVLLPGGDPRRACLVDFGLGRQRREESTLTRTGMVLGTPGYLSPEQALGFRVIDQRADLFALGVILYEALSGRPAFSGSNSLAVVCKVIAFVPPPLADLCPEAPLALIELCEAMLDKEPARRPADAAAVASSLEGIVIAPGGRRRARRISSVPATEVATELQLRPIRFVALAAPPLDDEGVPIPPDPARVATLTELASTGDITVASMFDGSLLGVVVHPDEREAARRAARLGLQMASLLSGAVVAVSGGHGADERTAVSSAIDDGSLSVATGVRESMFDMITGPVRAGAVRIDELTASLLPPQFVIERERGNTWLIAEAA